MTRLRDATLRDATTRDATLPGSGDAYAEAAGDDRRGRCDAAAKALVEAGYEGV